MRTVLISSIIVKEDRQRKEFNIETLDDLAETIKRQGLLHPIIIRSETDPTLVTGERRLRAFKLLNNLGQTALTHDDEVIPPHTIPFTTLEDLSETDYMEVELIENVQREDLSFQEYAIAVSKLHNLRLSQNPNQTASQTEEELSRLEGKAPNPTAVTKRIRDNLIISANLSDPEVAAAKTKKEALKIIKKKRTQEVFNAIATHSTQAGQPSKTPHTLIKGDASTLLALEAEETFDCIITDPPYGINAQSFGDQAGSVHAYDDTPEHFKSLMEVLSKESYRVAKERAHIYLFCDLRYFAYLSEVFGEAGWKVWTTPIIWYKSGGMLPRPEHGPRRTYEVIMFASKGDRQTLFIKPDCITHIPKPSSPIHAAEKPAALYVDLLGRTCRPGDRIIDPFAGSGPVFPAANALQLKATGYNLCDNDYALALSRLSENI